MGDLQAVPGLPAAKGEKQPRARVRFVEFLPGGLGQIMPQCPFECSKKGKEACCACR